ncbi:MAG: GNAT family N-acetyltransferase [Anaerolineae bacterium]|nr:GNAT family N-acetyltransferase [Anaerolineae bacterium]
MLTPSNQNLNADRTHLRPVNTVRDMPAVLDLIEIGFQNELDPQGWKLLKQMRAMTRQPGILRVQHSLRTDSAGFVWVEDDTVVANLSLRVATPSITQGRLIGNVVVHPDYRGKGIGHALVDTAISTARKEGARWIGLEVRQGNPAACKLYHGFGFYQVGTMIHLLRLANLPWPEHKKSQLSWRKSKPQDKQYWVNIANSCYGHVQKRILEIRDIQFTYGGWQRHLNLWLSGQRESAWLHNEPSPRYAVCVKSELRYKFQVWDLLMSDEAQPGWAQGMVMKAFSVARHTPPWPVIAMVANQPALIDALVNSGFHLHRTLLQMVLEL